MNSLIKALHVILTLTIFYGCSLFELKKPADAIDFPDEQFLDALIEAGVDTNGDGYITITEAKAVISLELTGIEYTWCHGNIFYPTCETELLRDISDISGIDRFINLESLTLSNKLFESIDLSNCTKLTYLELRNTKLSSLDLSGNLMLQQIMLIFNPDLEIVCVWEMPFPPEDVTLSLSSSPLAYFTADCN